MNILLSHVNPCFRKLPLPKDKNSIIYYDYVTVVCETEILRLPVLSILSVVPLCIPFLLPFEILFMIFDMI